MWCNPCRAVGIIHCAHPDECGNMLSDEAAADNWKAWLDDLPLDAGFSEGIGQVQDFISGTVARAEAAETALADMTKERDGLLTTWAESRKRHLTAETALAAERAKVAKLVEAGKALGLREIVAGWNGEGRDTPYTPHPAHLWATIKTTCGAVYALDAAITEAGQ